MSKRRNLMVCEACGAERRCSDGLRKSALRGEITCAKCATKGQMGYFVDAKAMWEAKST